MVSLQYLEVSNVQERGAMEEYDGENWIEIDKGLANQYFDGASVVVPCQ